MRFLGRKSSNNGPKAICRRILNKFNPSADRRARYEGVEGGEWLAIPMKLIKLEDVATSNHMSLVELAMATVRNRPSRKCRTTLMISDTSVELILNKQNLDLFAIGLDKVVTCFSLPFEPRAFALVYKKDSVDGYCCASLMLNDALTSLSGWEVWEMLTRKQMFFSMREMNRRFTAQTQLTGNTFRDTTSVSSPGCSLSCTSIDSLISSLQPCHCVDSSSLSTLTSIGSLNSFDSLNTISQSLGCSMSCISIDCSSLSILTSVTSFDSLSSSDSKSLNAELDPAEQIPNISSPKSHSDLSSSGTSVTSCQNGIDSLTSEADSSCTCCIDGVPNLEAKCEEAGLKFDAEVSISDDEEALKCSGPEPLSSSFIDFTDEAEGDGDDITSGSDSPANDEDVDSGTVLFTGSDTPLSPSADSSRTSVALVQAVPSTGDGTKDERLTDSSNASVYETSVTVICEDVHSPESEPEEPDGHTTAMEKQTGSADENEVSSDSDRSDDVNLRGVNSDSVITESECDVCSHDHDEIKTDFDDSCSSCCDHAQNSDCDKSKESNGRMTESEDSYFSFEKHQSQGTDSDSDLGDSCSCGDTAYYSSDDDKIDESDSDDSEPESEFESDSSSDQIDGNQRIGSDSDSHSSGENVHSSDCGESSDEADYDSCSCSSCCSCSCDECCNHESDSEVCYDSDSESSSDENTTNSDYDGDDEYDDESVKHWKCQPVTRISSQYSNKTVRLIHVQNVGLVVMAVSKADQDSSFSVSGRKSVEASSSLQMLKRLGREISFKRVPC